MTYYIGLFVGSLLLDFIIISLLSLIASSFLKGDKLKALRYSWIIYAIPLAYLTVFVSGNTIVHALTLPLVVWNLGNYYKKQLLKKVPVTETTTLKA